jgi:hypothetical protein
MEYVIGAKYSNSLCDGGQRAELRYAPSCLIYTENFVAPFIVTLP